MERKEFLAVLSLALLGNLKVFAQSTAVVPIELFFKDDGEIPNSRFPLLLYKNVFEARNAQGAAWLENQFEKNNWTNSWRNGIYSFHHYHSTSHEVLGIYSGKALVHLGGEKGKKVEISAGDIIVIPAGVGHKNLGSESLGVVGAYPDGRSWDIKTGKKGEHQEALRNIAALPIPETDPLLGKTGLPQLWKKAQEKL